MSDRKEQGVNLEHDDMTAEGADEQRRRLVRGGVAASSVILALKGRSALAATTCASPSAVMSGNLLHPSPTPRTPTSCLKGYSPGYWKVCQHLSQWKGLTPPTFPPNTCISGSPKSNPLTQGSLFKDIPPFAGSAGALGNYGAWRILSYPDQVDKELDAYNMTQIQLARHLIATYLNLKLLGSAFPVTEAQMADMWSKGSVDLYCPLGSGCTTAQLWTAKQIVCYLRNFTMDATDSFTWWTC